MEALREIRECPKHGNTEFSFHKSENRWRCLKCQMIATLKRRDKTKVMAIAYKGGRCLICGYHKYVGALEFHHIDPSLKDFGIASKGYTRSWEKNKEELSKCVLLCSNCHREVHAGIVICPEEIINDDNAAEKAGLIFDTNN